MGIKLENDIKVLKKDLEKHKNRKNAFWGIVVAVMTFVYGFYYAMFDGYLISLLEPNTGFSFSFQVGVIMMVLGSLKLIGVIFNVHWLRVVSLWLIALVWGGLLSTSLAFSFGTGYPNTVWLDRLLMVVICLRTSLKGVSYKK